MTIWVNEIVEIGGIDFEVTLDSDGRYQHLEVTAMLDGRNVTLEDSHGEQDIPRTDLSGTALQKHHEKYAKQCVIGAINNYMKNLEVLGDEDEDYEPEFLQDLKKIVSELLWSIVN